MEFDIKAVETAIENANKAIESKAKNAEEMAMKAINSAKEAIDSLAKSKDATDLEIKSLRDDYNEMASKFSKANFNNSAPELKSWIAQFADQYSEKKSDVDAIISGKASRISFELKEAINIGTNNTIDAVGSIGHYNLTQNTGIVSQIRKRVTNYLNTVSVGALAMESPYAKWIEELDEQGVPIFIAEADPKTKISVRYEEREKKAKKIAVHGKVTTEMLKYLPQLVSFLQNNMMRRVDIATEQQLLTGDDLANNLKGVINYATAFTGGDMAGTVEADTINDWDVILGAISQARKANGLVNGFFVKGGKLDALLAVKDTTGQYILPAGVSVDAQGNISAWGVPIYRTEASLGAFDFFGGDLSVINVGFTGAMTIEIDKDGNDFTNNMRTIVVEQEIVQFVSANDVPVLVKGTFAAAKTLLSA